MLRLRRASRLWLLQESMTRDSWHLLKKQTLASRAGTHSPFGCPAREGQKRRTEMTNEIRKQQATNDGKPMVSWAALLTEAVTKPGFIHEAYSRFHNYS